MASKVFKIVFALFAATQLVSANQDSTTEDSSSNFVSKRPLLDLQAIEGEGNRLGVQRTVKAGFVSTFTQKFFDTYKSLLMKLVEEKMQTIELQDVCSEESFGQFFAAFLCRTD
jgi:hypothetical protein